MGYEMGLEMATKQDFKKLANVCDLVEVTDYNDKCFWYACGWGIANYSWIFKDLGKEIKAKSDEFDDEWEIKISDLMFAPALVNQLKQNGLYDLIMSADNEEDWFNKVLKNENYDKANELEYDLTRYEQLTDKSVISEIRKADLDKATELRKEADKVNSDFKKGIIDACKKADAPVDFDEVLLYDTNYFLFSVINTLAPVVKKIREVFGGDYKVRYYG